MELTKNEILTPPVGIVVFDFFNVFTKKHRILTVKNMFVTAGKVSIASRLRGTTANNVGEINWCALGTGTTAPALGDTDLQTELYRKQISVRSFLANVATFQTFFTTEEANGTLREAGLFGDDASSTPGSGTLYCRTAINRTKTSNDTLSLTWSVTIG